MLWELMQMKEYAVLLQHRKNKTFKDKSVLKLTFSEAVTEAYRLRSIMGFEWEINHIKRVK